LLLQESQDAIREAAATQGFTEHHTATIDASTDWPALFSLSQAMSLFASRQTLLLVLPENGPNAAINEQLATLVSMLHDDLLLIVRGNKLTKAQENAAWVTALASRAVQVSCQTPEYAQLPRWLAARAKQHHLQLDDAASQLLCYCYEGNLLALAQALERLSAVAGRQADAAARRAGGERCRPLHALSLGGCAAGWQKQAGAAYPAAVTSGRQRTGYSAAHAPARAAAAG
jgi:DNA polymerase-3 subunit delta